MNSILRFSLQKLKKKKKIYKKHFKEDMIDNGYDFVLLHVSELFLALFTRKNIEYISL